MTPTDDFDTQLASLLSSPAVWQADQPAATPPPRIRELSNLAARLAKEDRDGAELVATLAKSPSAWWRTTVAKAPHGKTSGVVRQLLEQMRRVIHTSPAQALELTSLAVAIANDIALTDYPSDFVISFRADAWRDHAYVLHYLGRLPEALAAIEEAERLAAETLLPEYTQARAKLVRAHILAWSDHREEAIGLARSAAETFLEFGDRAKYVTARITEANLLHDHGSIGEALAIWNLVKNEESLEESTRVTVMYSIGLAHRELGNTTKAIEHITIAIAEYDLLGMNDSVLRARWALATTLVSAGKFNAAIPLFDKIWKEFELLELEADAALVALELVETLLVVGQPERVPQICRSLLDRFTRAGMASRAITALSYLREVVAIGKVQPPVVRQVREFLRDLPSQGRPTLSIPLPGSER